jgi:hypothetical protein
MDFWSTFGPWAIGAVGGAMGAAALLPTRWGEALIKYRFDKEIESFKSEQGAKLERLREQLGHLGDRGRRSNELEFASIREVWEKTIEAHLATADCVTNFMEYPDLNKLGRDDIESFLSTTPFSKEQRDQILQAADHNDTYMKIVIWRSIAHAETVIFKARLLLRMQRIFMPDDLRAQFQALIELCAAAQLERQLQFQHPHIPRNEWGDNIRRFRENATRDVDSLAASVNRRLFRSELSN